MEEIKVSVIVPIYKVESYLDRCINSIVQQTYQNIEIILVDDGSPDSCPALCDQWAKTDIRIKVLHKSNGGLASARNAGINIAQGIYIGFVDSDDYIDKDMYRLLVNQALESDSDIVSCGYHEFDHDTDICKKENTVFELSVDEAIKSLLTMDTKVLSFAWNKLYKKAAIGDIRFVEKLTFGEDTPFVYSVLKESKRYSVIPQATYYYMRRPDSLIGNHYKSFKLLAVTAARLIEHDCREHNRVYLNEAVFFSALQLYCVFKEFLLSDDTKNNIKDYRYLRMTMKEYSLNTIYSFSGFKMALQWELCKVCPHLFCFIKKRHEKYVSRKV